MINNFQTLMILIHFCENQIKNIKSEIWYAEWKSDFKKIAQLEAKIILLQTRIVGYIEAYKSKIKNNHLEIKIFGSKLEFLENHYQKTSLKHERNNLLR